MESIIHLPEPFNFYKSILRGDHLHFGLWPSDNPDLSVEEAQQHMFETILGFFPKPPVAVLDVGCGLGLSAAVMAGKGYDVVAISPSGEMIEYALKHYGKSGAFFKEVGFYDEDVEVFQDSRYDVILFQESSQYLGEPEKFVQKARRLLNDRGFIIISDEVCYDRSIKAETAVHMATEISATLAEKGFCILENLKLGDRVMKTCDVAIQSFIERFDSLVSNDPEKRESLILFLEGWKKQKQWYSKGQMGYEIFVARKDDFFIRQYIQGDEIQIIEMFKEAFHVDRSLEHWNWKFRDNPFGNYIISEAFSKEGRLVAHYGSYPVPFYNDTGVGLRTFVSCQVGDTMTKAEVRNVGLGKTNLLSRTVYHCYARFFEGQMPFAYGFNTGKIKVIGKRYLGYKFLDEVIFRVKDILKNPIKKPGWPRIFLKFKVEEIDSFTAEWDKFFERVCHSYKLLVRRDSQYLKWRYLDCPDKDYKILSIHRGSKLVGWSVFLKKDNRLIWGDALFDNSYPEAVTHLLKYLQDNSVGRGIERIEGWFSKNPKWWNDILDKIGFDIEEEPNHFSFCYKIFAEPDMTEVLEKYLYYSSGDSDLF